MRRPRAPITTTIRNLLQCIQPQATPVLKSAQQDKMVAICRKPRTKLTFNACTRCRKRRTKVSKTTFIERISHFIGELFYPDNGLNRELATTRSWSSHPIDRSKHERLSLFRSSYYFNFMRLHIPSPCLLLRSPFRSEAPKIRSLDWA